ncbi:MAG: GNAT family N-acetyltransferase [Spirochaetota bacterium]
MEYEIIYDTASGFVAQSAKLHYDALSYRSFITFFGKGFLRELYTALLKDGNAFIAAAHEGTTLAGFLLGCFDSTKMIPTIVRRWYRFLPHILLGVVRNPSVIGKLVETLFYSEKEGEEIKPELVVIAVDGAIRSKGIGAGLVSVMDEEFKRRGVATYKVTVHNEMERSNHFYRKLGMTLAKSFTLYGVVWNVYTNTIGRRA